MEQLDLSRHGRSELQGKHISCNGRAYEIGECLAYDKTVYKLINTESKLIFHILKVWPSPVHVDEANAVRARLVRRKPELGRNIPISITVSVSGGTVELEVYPGPYDESSSSTTSIMAEATRLSAAGKVTAAIRACERVLSINPHHAVALLELAAMHARRGNFVKAFTQIREALDIERNYLPYHQAYIECAARVGELRDALDAFLRAKKTFCNVHDLDHLGARLHLECGEPEEALRCAQDCCLDDKKKQELLNESSAALKAKEAAAPLVQRAERIVRRSGRPVQRWLRTLFRMGRLPGFPDNSRVTQLLREAQAIYPKDPLACVNLALSLRRDGDHRSASDILITAARAVPYRIRPVCCANAAFNEIEMGNFTRGVMALEAMDHALAIVLGSPRESWSPFDLPFIGIWVEATGMIEELPGSAAALVSKAVEECSKEGVVKENIVRLCWAYRQAAEAVGRRA
jgi:tetratricopeptide (TPR) repeat protein